MRYQTRQCFLKLDFMFPKTRHFVSYNKTFCFLNQDVTFPQKVTLCFLNQDAMIPKLKLYAS